jgi:hypothetical protein
MTKPVFLGFLAMICLAGGCASPTVRFEAPSRGPEWLDAGTPSGSVAVRWETRYYRDDEGRLWDDRSG